MKLELLDDIAALVCPACGATGETPCQIARHLYTVEDLVILQRRQYRIDQIAARRAEDVEAGRRRRCQ